MAQVPEGATLPSVQAQPGGLPRVEATTPPNATLTGVLGQAAENLGKGAQEFSDVLAKHALQIQQFNNQAAADVNNTGYTQEVSSITDKFKSENQNIDPTKRDALFAGYAAQIEAVRQKYHNNLTNMAAQSLFDQDSRRTQNMFLQRTSGSVAEAVDNFKDTAFKGAQQTDATLAATSTNPAEQEAIKQRSATRAYAYAQSKGMGGDAAQAFVNNENTKIDVAIIDQLLKKDSKAAWSYLNAHNKEINSEVLGPLSKEVDEQLYADLNTEGAAAAQQHFNAGIQAPGAPGTAPAMPSGIALGTPHGGLSAQMAGVETAVTGAFPGARITSEGRTAAQNAKAGGVADSAHLEGPGGANAIHMHPPPGVSGPQFAAQIQARFPGVHAVYEGPGAKHSTAPHVHVQLGTQGLAGGGGATPGAAQTALENNAPAMMAYVDNYAKQQAGIYGLDETRLRDGMETKLRADAEKTDWAYNQSQKAGISELSDFLAHGGPGGGEVDDFSQVLRDPHARAIYNGLSGSDQAVFRNKVTIQANTWEPGKQDEFDTLKGLSLSDPKAFAAIHASDPQYHLTHDMVKQISALQFQNAKRDESQKNYTARYQQITNNQGVISAQEGPNGLKPNTPEMDLFMGRMMAWADKELEDPKLKGKIPDEAIAAKARELLAKRGGDPGYVWSVGPWKGQPFPGMGPHGEARPPIVPDAAAAKIRTYLARKEGIPEDQVSNEEIGGMYQATLSP